MPARRGARALLALLLALGGAPAHARDPHDATARHSFADAAYWSSVFDDPARDAWQKPEALVDALQLGSGMAVADLGAGTGYLERRLAAAVGPSGVVYAVEIEPSLVTHLRDRAEREATSNVVPVLASRDDARLPPGRIDRILVLDTWHHLDDRIAYARRLRRALAPAGRLAVVDWKPGRLPEGPPPEHKVPRKLVERELRQAGFRVSVAGDVLPYQWVLIAE